MRYSIYIVFVFFALLTLVACDPSKEKEKEITLMKADWSDTTAMAKAIDIYYKDSVIKQGKVSLKVRDAFLRSEYPYQHLQIQKIKRQEFKQASPTIGYMPVLMASPPRVAVADFQITWQQITPEDSLGEFVVTDVFVQQLDEQPRYEWIKENDNYWIRKNVEVSENVQQGRQGKNGQPELEIDPKLIKKR